MQFGLVSISMKFYKFVYRSTKNELMHMVQSINHSESMFKLAKIWVFVEAHITTSFTLYLILTGFQWHDIVI